MIAGGPVEQAGRAGAEAGQLDRACGDRCRTTMRRRRPPVREMCGDHERQHEENRDRGQDAGPPARLAVPALDQDIIHNPHRPKHVDACSRRYFRQPIPGDQVNSGIITVWQ